MQEIKGSKGEYPLIFAKLVQPFIHLLKPLLYNNKKKEVCCICELREGIKTQGAIFSQENCSVID